MLQYHVSCGLSKKVIAVEEEGCSKVKIRNKVSTAFSVKDADIVAIQYYDQAWEDWLDIEDEVPPTKSKLQVVYEKPVKDQPSEPTGQPAVTSAQADNVQLEWVLIKL